MRLRSEVIALSTIIAVLSIISIATANRTRPPQVRVVTVAAPAARPSVHRLAPRPAPHPAPKSPPKLAPATVMTSPNQAATAPSSAPLSQMVGQQVMVRMTGTTPDPSLLVRIREGQVGGVILYGENIASPSQVAALVAQLQSAAQAGGNPRLLISTDQEGGLVRRLPWAAPDLSAQEMGAQGAGTAGNEGRATGEALRAVGINVNLAPDADVAHTTSAFIWQQRRSFGTDSVTVRDSTTAFATGLEGAGVAPAAKHFPGLGSALTDTDYAMQRVRMRPDDLIPFEALITQQIPLIMVSTAVYTNLDPSNPAALSPAVISGLLRQQLQYQGVVMTDDLERPTGGSTADAAVRADQAGADIILVSTSESGGAVAYNALLQAAQAGQISQARIAEAYSRITLLKQRYAGS